ncbi:MULTISPECIES: GumC family protein [Chromobacterium]|nr:MULTISPECIES: Wzz/FepE/Etk N-terminal domain-containing protein [Chromobacterium]WSE92358.1 Wzz/FepE/Etk N-terminal domain-containing protein [Chromobacterium subtsugae]WVH60736.1 Wzz/FepE/Etk N-terminal domain-containing protein [Chromobacterium subtsugae]
MQTATDGRAKDEVDLPTLLAQLARHKRWIASSTLLFGAAALAYCLLAKPVFTATTSIMPPQQQNNGMSALLGQLGGLAGAAGGLTGLKNPNDLYIGMLQSRSVADKLIQRYQLKQRYQQDTMDATRKALQGLSSFANGKDGLISISVDDGDPKFAAALANGYVEELKAVNQSLAVTDAAKRRLFFEQQLKQTKDLLTEAESELRKTQEKTGMVLPEGQLPAIVGSVTQLRANIAAKEVQLEAMKSFATAQNPLYIRAEQELAGLREQLAKLETGDGNGRDMLVPTGKVAQSGLEYLRRLREVKYQETIFELLSKQYELARIDEAKDSSLIQVLDAAVPPELRSKPKRSLVLALGLFAGLLVGTLAALLRARLDERGARRGPSQAEPAFALKNNG